VKSNLFFYKLGESICGW